MTTPSESRECHSCGWLGTVADTLMLGSVGPLCPDCRETTETVVPPTVCGGCGVGNTFCAAPNHKVVTLRQTWCDWKCRSCGGAGRDTWD